MSGPRGGRRGCGWRRCRWPGTDPARLAAGFCGSERTVAEYLLAEVLDRQSEEVRRLLLRTSRPGAGQRRAGRPADRGSGRGAGAAGPGGGERVRGVAGRGAGPGSATTTCSPACCSWSCAAPQPGEVTALHAAAAGWLAGHGFPVEAVRHAQAAAGLGAGRPAAGRSLAGPASGRAGRDRARAAGRVPGRGRRGGCRAGGGGRGG